MCVLIVGVRWRDELPLVLAASRDESRARAATLPESVVQDGMRVLRPRDLRAGGTWIGTNAAGVVVAITNRRDGSFEPWRRSRGSLCAAALAEPNAEAAVRHVETAVQRDPCNSFNLLVADAQVVQLVTWNGTLHVQALDSGTHVLSNEHAIGELELPEVVGLDGAPGPLLRGGLIALLGSHAPRDACGFQICKHGDDYGTVSATLVYRRRDGSTLLEHAAGPACTTPFSLYRLV